jgi:tetratricopeptide (TPR) repeat protein
LGETARWGLGSMTLSCARLLTKGIAAVLEVSSDGEGAAWSVIPDGGPELYLREDDMVELERTFGVERYELGGHDVPSSAPTPVRALLEPLCALRAPAIEAFVTRLVPAVGRALAANSIAPLSELFASKPSVASSGLWFAQAIIGKNRAHEPIWNDAAIHALEALVGPDIDVDVEAVRGLVGPFSLMLGFYRGDAKLGIQIGSAGRVSLTTGDGWTEAELAETSLEAVARAVAALEDEAYETAIAILDEAATQSDADISVQLNRASADYGLGRIREALAGYEAILPRLRGPEQAFVYSNMAALYRELEDSETALQVEKRATEVMPGNADAWYEYGLTLVKRGAFDDCIAAEQRALALEPAHADAHYAIACAYALRNRGDDREHAIRHVAEAIDCDPDLADDIAGDEDFASVRDDLRFVKLVR